MNHYTSLNQSKKLLEIGISPESADMCYVHWGNGKYTPHLTTYTRANEVNGSNEAVPCWSLGALLELMPFPTLSHDKLGSGKTGWMVKAYPDNHRIDSCWHNSSIDACVEMIIKLKEQKYI